MVSRDWLVQRISRNAFQFYSRPDSGSFDFPILYNTFGCAFIMYRTSCAHSYTGSLIFIFRWYPLYWQRVQLEYQELRELHVWKWISRIDRDKNKLRYRGYLLRFIDSWMQAMEREPNADFFHPLINIKSIVYFYVLSGYLSI